MKTIRLGTRGSRLAMTQAEAVASALKHGAPDWEIEICVVKTKGDVIQDVPLSQVKGQGFFVKEIEAALLRHEVDLAVHSCKDLPTKLATGLALGAVPARVDPSDCLVARGFDSLEALPAGATVATSALRRQALIAWRRPDLARAELRGNVDTRLAKLDAGQFDAMIVARAALVRLGKTERATEVLSLEEFMPAPAQGALAVEVREEDDELRALAATIDDVSSHAAIRAERALLASVGSGCQVPLGCLCTPTDGKEGELVIRSCLVSLDGRVRIDAESRGPLEEAEAIGEQAARKLLEGGGDGILAQMEEAAR